MRFPIRSKYGADCVMTPCSRHCHIDEWIYRGSERLEAIRQTIDVTLSHYKISKFFRNFLTKFENYQYVKLYNLINYLDILYF